ncbi:winged helix DNA-binding domain-containing protein [Streptomyces sp. NPDC048639]|uniref:winged helix DNA-binding domain-containing protein n=1 Tax=Streptomyces sp. NPDC048639 TaxID=3365581 RepID=UPI00371531C5
MLKATRDQVLAWRLRQQGLTPRTMSTVAELAERLAGVQAQVASSAELAIATRQRKPRAGAVEKALADRTVVKTWSMRGTLHLLVPEQMAAFQSLLAAARTWEKPSWQRSFGVTPDQMERLGDAVDELLDGGRAMSRAELTEAIIAMPGYGDLREQLTSGWGTVLKPLAWTGHLCHGSGEGNRTAFVSPRSHVPGWTGVPEPEEAARVAVPAYLRAHGPATAEAFDAWLIRGLTRKADMRARFASLGDRLTEVDVDGDGERAYLLAEDADGLARTKPSKEVRLLAGFDQYVLGPGTADTRLIAADRRKAVSRTAGWISPVVVHEGRVAGVWDFTDDGTVDVRLFAESGAVPKAALEAEVAHLAACTGRGLELSVRTV